MNWYFPNFFLTNFNKSTYHFTTHQPINLSFGYQPVNPFLNVMGFYFFFCNLLFVEESGQISHFTNPIIFVC